jgi:hypothetical protein
MDEWEYRVHETLADTHALQAQLRGLGQDGWELVAVNVGAGGTAQLFLKRPATGIRRG